MIILWMDFGMYSNQLELLDIPKMQGNYTKWFCLSYWISYFYYSMSFWISKHFCAYMHKQCYVSEKFAIKFSKMHQCSSKRRFFKTICLDRWNVIPTKVSFSISLALKKCKKVLISKNIFHNIPWVNPTQTPISSY